MQQDRWQPLLSTVASVHRYRWLKHNVQGPPPQSSLMATIVEFALKEEPLDVEKMRKCLLKQVGAVRLQLSVCTCIAPFDCRVNTVLY